MLVAEFLLALVNLGTTDFAIRAAGGIQKTEDSRRVFHFIFHVAAGAVLGGVSLLLFPKTFLNHSLIRVLNLILSPLLIGIVFHVLGKRLSGQNKKTTRMEHFSGAFEFSFSFCLIRFFFAT